MQGFVKKFVILENCHSLIIYSPSERNTIDLVRASDQEQTSFQLLQNNHSLTLVDSSQQDGDHSGSKRLPHISLVLGEEVDRGSLGGRILGGDVVGHLLDTHHASASILGSSDLLLHKCWLLSCFLLGDRLLGELVDGFLAVCSTPAESVHTTVQGVVAGLALVLVLSHTSERRNNTKVHGPK